MNILTFDLEEWFHCDVMSDGSKWDRQPPRFEENLHRILDSLDRRSLKASFLCLGWIARRYPDAIRRVHALGHDVGSHSDMHKLVHTLERNEFSADLERSVKTLEDLTGAKVRAYRAPAFSITASSAWAFEELARCGIEVDLSVFPARRDYGGMPGTRVNGPCIIEHAGIRLREFPMNVTWFARRPFVFSGGGYFRLFPYSWIRHCCRRSDYVMTYFHPRDFDPDQPVLRHLTLLRSFKAYYGLSSAFEKFERWLDDFPFVSLSEAETSIDWSAVEVLHLDGSPRHSSGNLGGTR